MMPADVMLSLFSEDGFDEGKVLDVLKFRPGQKSKFFIALLNIPDISFASDRPGGWSQISDKEVSYWSVHSVFRL